MLDDLLARLAEEKPLDADLLRGRFWERCTVGEMGQVGRPVVQSERQFYNQQREAIEQFTQLLCQQDRHCRQQQAEQCLSRRLPMPSYDQLYGVDGYVDQLLGWLRQRHHYSIVVIKGIGGIGKTCLADYSVRRWLTEVDDLHDLVWISAKQEYLSAAGITGAASRISLEDLFDQLSLKLDISQALRLPLAQRIDLLAAELRRAPYLVVIDNLETIEDGRLLAPWLERLARPTQFLLTSRERLPSLTNVRCLELSELDREASLALISRTAETRGVNDVDPERVYALVGGNPLAILLTVSQMHYLPPEVVLSTLTTGRAELYTYIYWNAWSMLNAHAREILLAIQRAGDQADWTWLKMVLDLSPQALQQALHQLIDLSLVQPQQHSQGGRIFAIHRLTSTFLRAEVLGWT